MTSAVATEGVRATGQITGQVTDVDGRTVEIEIPYNVVDSYGTVWLPGCFTRSLQRKLPPVLMHHDTKILVGRVTGYRDTPTAMQMTIRLADPSAVPDARAAQSLLREGVIDGVSFFYDLDKPTEQNVTLQRSRFGGAPCFKSVTLNEVSFVTIPSVPGARVLAVRSAATEEELTPEELDEIERMIAVGYPPAELSVMRSRQDLNLEVRVRDALAKLDGRRSTAMSDADLRARADALPPKPLTEEEQAQRRNLEISDRTPPDPNFLREYFGTDKPTQLPTGALMPETPPNDIMRAGVDAGMDPAEIVANWRKRWGKTDVRHVDAPSARHGFAMPYPPQDLVDCEAQNGMHPAETIRRWRVRYGYET